MKPFTKLLASLAVLFLLVAIIGCSNPNSDEVNADFVYYGYFSGTGYYQQDDNDYHTVYSIDDEKISTVSRSTIIESNVIEYILKIYVSYKKYDNYHSLTEEGNETRTVRIYKVGNTFYPDLSPEALEGSLFLEGCPEEEEFTVFNLDISGESGLKFTRLK